MKTLTICSLGYHDPEGTRHWVMKRGLQTADFCVIECRTTASGFWRKYRDLIRQYRATCRSTDVILIPFPGHYVVPLAWLLRLFSRKPIVFDAFISLYDTMVDDRKLIHPSYPKAWVLKFIDWLSCTLATVVLVDTPQHREFFHGKYGISLQKILVVPVGSRTDIFKPNSRPISNPTPLAHCSLGEGGNPHFTVFFCGTFIPLHGIETILHAAHRLQQQGENVRFQLIGKGQLYPAMQKLAQNLRLKNTEFLGMKSTAEVAQHLNNADIALGTFGTSGKAMRVIPHKVYDALACGTAVITGDTPAARTLLTNQENAMLTPCGDADALAGAIITLRRNAGMKEQIAKNGHTLFNTSCSLERVTHALVAWLRACLHEPNHPI